MPEFEPTHRKFNPESLADLMANRKIETMRFGEFEIKRRPEGVGPALWYKGQLLESYKKKELTLPEIAKNIAGDQWWVAARYELNGEEVTPERLNLFVRQSTMRAIQAPLSAEEKAKNEKTIRINYPDRRKKTA